MPGALGIQAPIWKQTKDAQLKEDRMKLVFSPEKYLVLLQDNGKWVFREFDSRDEVDALLEAHKEAVLVRFAVVTNGVKASFECRCEAVKEAAEKKAQVSLMQPHRSLQGEAQIMYYSAL